MATRTLCQTACRHARALLRPAPALVVTPHANSFWEPDKKGGYDTKIQKPVTEKVRHGMSMMGTEVIKWKSELHEKLRSDPIFDLEHGDYEILWKFDDTKTIEDWILTVDRDHNEGKSNAHFHLGKGKTGIFEGYLNTQVPKDGIIKHAGYCNIRSPKHFLSFKRERPYDWSTYTHLLMRVRGDGRPYQLVLGMDRYFDIQWNDQYNFALFTHGGPYWQLAKIPFSKFFLSSRGRIQDKQQTIVNQLDRISYLGVTCADGHQGPFQLEIDYIGVVYDGSHSEDFAYEMYEVSPYIHC